jgi:hypothetical protein
MIIFLQMDKVVADIILRSSKYKAEIGGDVLTFEKGDYHI